MTNDNDSIFGPVIHRYTREEAIRDEVLRDVTTTAREAGFRWPVAVTAKVWADVISPTKGAQQLGQSREGRLWDVLNVARVAIAQLAPSARTPEVPFRVLVSDGSQVHHLVELKIHLGPGDAGEPVLTIMRPGED